MKKAFIVVIEGTDGSGKETQSKNIQEYYENKGHKVKRYSFPNYNSPTGKIVGGPYLGKKEIQDSFFEETSAFVDPLVSSLYYAADRRYNFLNEIEEELFKNDLIILDRYTTSNMGHQISKAKTKQQADKILNFIETLEFDLCELPRPDCVIFLHMPFQAAKELRKNREYSDGNESCEEHLIKAEKTYVDLAKDKKWDYINCINTNSFSKVNDIKTINQITNEIVQIIDEKLKNVSNETKKMTKF